MRVVSLVVLVVELLVGWGGAQFLNNRPFPTYSLESMPDTGFTCRDKILGGYYADPETQCQMFHVCVKVAGIGVQDFRFLCPNGTAFDQDHQICADWDDVDCDATTLYYSSDNFDLYRLGSGFESKAVKYGEEEETFALQRAETGDARLNREHQAQRVNQQRQFNSAGVARKLNTNTNANNNYFPSNNNNQEKDIFKGSSSSNFFNNRNNGKEVDDDDDDVRGESNSNLNQNHDRDIQRKKVIRKQQRRPQQQQQQQQQQQKPTPAPIDIVSKAAAGAAASPSTQVTASRSSRPTVFANNFAGSSYAPTTARPAQSPDAGAAPATAAPVAAVPRVRNSHRRFPQQSVQFTTANADSTNAKGSSAGSTQPHYTISTPAPFRQTQQYQRPSQQSNAPTTKQQPTSSTENYPSNFPQKPLKHTVTPSTQAKPFRATKQVDNYPTTPALANPSSPDFHYDVPRVVKTTKAAADVSSSKQTQGVFNKQSTTPFRQQGADNYPTTFAPKTRFDVKQHNQQPTTFAPKANFAYNQNRPSNGQNANSQQSQFTNNQQQQYDANNFQQNNNYQAPFRNSNTNNNNNNHNSASTQAVPSTQAQTQERRFQENAQYQPVHGQPFAKQFSGQLQQTNPPVQNNVATKQQQANNNQFGANFQQTTQRSSAITQYTPTVPKVTSTTPASRARFDETQYDDGSYDPKYDNYDNNGNNPSYKDDEFLKTAHSQNIASSRNEYIQNAAKQAAKQAVKQQATTTPKPFYNESPRPFSVSPNTPKVTEYPKTTKTAAPQNSNKTPVKLHPKSQNQASTKSDQQPPQQQQQPQQQQTSQAKDSKSYDYAYYDTNVGDVEYDSLDADFQKDFRKTQ